MIRDCGQRMESCRSTVRSIAYSNTVPLNQSLPASLFLSAKPSWWQGAPWPAVGPDVNGGNGPGGHTYDIFLLKYATTPLRRIQMGFYIQREYVLCVRCNGKADTTNEPYQLR